MSGPLHSKASYASFFDRVGRATALVTFLILLFSGLPDAPVALAQANSPKVTKLQFSRESLWEKDGTVTLRATLDQEAPAGGLHLPLKFSGTATRSSPGTNDSDYTVGYHSTATGVDTMFFRGGSRTGGIVLAPRADGEVEDNETVTVTVGGETATVTIISYDEEPPLPPLAVTSLQFDPPSVAEAGGQSTLKVKLNRKALGRKVIYLTRYSGTAKRGVDYTAPAYILVPGGSDEASMVVNVRDDEDFETDETVTVTLKGGKSATLTITNDDAAEKQESVQTEERQETAEQDLVRVTKLQFNRPSLWERGGALTLRATLDQEAPAGGLKLDLKFSGTATKGDDYTAVDTMFFKGGGRTSAIVVRPLADGKVENDETVTVTVGGQSATMTIISYDTDPPLPDLAVTSLQFDPPSVAEAGGGQSTLKVKLNRKVLGQRVIYFPRYSGTAKRNVDYTAPIYILIPGGEDEGSMVVNVHDDERFEGANDTVIVTLKGGMSATLKIIDDDGGQRESVLADERRETEKKELANGVSNFAKTTNEVATASLTGNTFTQGSEGNAFRTTLHELMGFQQSETDRAWNVWASLNRTEFQSSTENKAFDVYMGADFKLAPGTVIGFLGSYETADVGTSDGTGNFTDGGTVSERFSNDGWSFGGYLGLRLDDDLILDVAGTYGSFSPNISGVAEGGDDQEKITGSYNADRFYLSSHLTGRMAYGNFVISPQLGLVYARKDLGAFTDSEGVFVPAETLGLIRLAFSPTVAYDFGLAREYGKLHGTVTATGRADALQFGKDGVTVSAGVSFGLQWENTSGFSLELDGRYDGIGEDEVDESYDGRITAKWKF